MECLSDQGFRFEIAEYVGVASPAAGQAGHDNRGRKAAPTKKMALLYL